MIDFVEDRKIDFTPDSPIDFEPDRTLVDFMAEPEANPPSSPLTPNVLPEIKSDALQAVPQTAMEVAKAQAGESEPLRIGEKPIELPKFGEPNTRFGEATRMVTGVGEWALNNPLEFVISLHPLGRVALAAKYGPDIARTIIADVPKAVAGDPGAQGRLIGLSALIVGPEAAKRGYEKWQVEGPSRIQPPSPDQVAREGMKPAPVEVPPEVKTETPPLTADALEKTAKAAPKEEAKPVEEAKPLAVAKATPIEETWEPSGEIRRTESGAFEWVENGKVLDTDLDPSELIGRWHSDNAGYSTRVRQVSKDRYELDLADPKDPENPTHELFPLGSKAKPAPVVSEQAPEAPAPTTAVVSQAKEGVGKTAPSPSAISEPTPKVEETQPATVEPTETQGALTGARLLPSTLATVSTPVKGLHEITADLAKGIGVPIRFGRLTTTKFGGYFKPLANLIGSKKAVDMPTVSHEVGHKLDSRLKFSTDPTLASELDALGDPATPGSMSSWTKSKSRTYKMGEGLAEFVRYWLTDPTEAVRKAPTTFAAFERAMDANADWGDVMRRAQDDIQLWRGAQDQMRLRSHISIGENPNRTPYRLRQLTRDLVDDLHFLRLVVDDAERMSGAKLAPTENIYVLARNMRGAFGRADTFIRDGVVDFKTKRVTLGTSLEDALKPIAGHLDDFRDWIVAKRAKELHQQGRDTGLVQSDIDSVAARFDRVPEFQEAFRKVKEWNAALLQYMEDSGFITPEARAAMEKMNQDYVPLHRLFEIGAGEISSQESMGTGRGLNVGTPGSLKKLHGSVRPIVDPLETMVKNAYTMTVAAEKGYIHQQLAALADKPGMGKWVERIRNPMESQKVGLEKIREQLEAAGADLSAVPDDLMLQYFKQSGRAPFGENIIRVMRGGKAEFYRLNSELFDTFHALDMEDGGKIIQILSTPANLLRAGVTLAPDFALANAMRDAFSSAIVSRYTMIPFEAVIRGVSAMVGNPKLVAEWKAAGGKHSIEANYFDRAKLQQFMAEKITKDLTPMERALIYAKSPLAALRALSSLAEEATRIGEYSVSYNKARKGGMSEGDARALAAFESRDRQDFAKGGAKTKAIRMLAAFWNAGLQANVKLVQAFKERPVKTTLAGLAFITGPKMIEQALNYDDQDYWDRPLWERDLFFLFPIGKDENKRTRFLRIPTPFEPGIIFGTFPGRLVAFMREKDPDAFRNFANSLLQQTVPNPIPNTLQAIFENFLSGKKGWDIFRGRQIVPDSLADLPPDMQWTEQTSLTAKKLGSLIGFSPMKIDHMIAQTTGGLGRQLTYNFADLIISKATGEDRTAKGVIPGGRFITTPAGITSQSIEDFYQNLSRIQGEEQRLKQTGKGEDWARLATGFRKASDAIAGLRKAARNSTSDTEKQDYYLQMSVIARDMNNVAKQFHVPK